MIPRRRSSSCTHDTLWVGNVPPNPLFIRGCRSWKHGRCQKPGSGNQPLRVRPSSNPSLWLSFSRAEGLSFPCLPLLPLPPIFFSTLRLELFSSRLHPEASAGRHGFSSLLVSETGIPGRLRPFPCPSWTFFFVICEGLVNRFHHLGFGGSADKRGFSSHRNFLAVPDDSLFPSLSFIELIEGKEIAEQTGSSRDRGLHDVAVAGILQAGIITVGRYGTRSSAKIRLNLILGPMGPRIPVWQLRPGTRLGITGLENIVIFSIPSTSFAASRPLHKSDGRSLRFRQLKGNLGSACLSSLVFDYLQRWEPFFLARVKISACKN